MKKHWDFLPSVMNKTLTLTFGFNQLIIFFKCFSYIEDIESESNYLDRLSE